jgi:hypothetical protein
MATLSIKPCGYSRNPDPKGHRVQVVREGLQDFLEFRRGDSAYRVVCTCTACGPLAGTEDAAILLHNQGLLP